MPEAAQLAAQRANFLLQIGGTRHARQNRLELFEVDRLDQIVGSAQAQGLDGRLDAGVARNHDHLGGRTRFDVLKQVHAVAVGQHQVQQHHVGPLQRHVFAGSLQARRRRYSKPLASNQFLQALQGIDVVID